MPIPEFLRERTQAAVGSLNAHRILLYGAVSTIAVTAAIVNALRNYSNFYSVAIYLSKSSRSVLVLANFGLLIALLCGHLVQQIFFGTLRAPEVERLYDRLWFFITESLLAFTIFRDEFDIPFALMFGFLLFVKSFHWLSADRIEWMEQRPYPGPPISFHVRMAALFIILSTIDFLMFIIAVENTVVYGVGGMVLFASEYAILMASVSNTIAKYALSTYELHRAGRRGGENAPPWDNKSMFVFYIELVTDFLKLSTYLVFFTIIITFYGLPLNIVRDVYITARSFITRLRALRRYQTATRNMDQRYPDATAEEMSQMNDRTCIICREEMIPRVNPTEDAAQAPAQADGPNTTPKKLPCGHIFHFHCLRSWLERQQSCPTCRRTVLDPNPPGPQPPTGGVPVPQPPPQAGVPVNPHDQGGQNPHGMNNPLGFMGRLFGPGPAQAGQGGPAEQNLPVLQGDRPQDVIIQYHIQYRPHAPADAPAAVPEPAQEPMPIPRLVEFQGPGNVFHPWEMDNRWFDERAPQDPPTSVPPPSATTPATPEASSSSSATPSTVPESAATASVEQPMDPRRAAAESALRRQMSANQKANLQPSSASSPTDAAPAVAAPSTDLVVEPAVPENDFSIPSLIPIYGVTPEELAQSKTPLQSRDTGHLQTSFLSESGLSVSESRAGPSVLPPALSNSQLAALDTLTREAIDERLRILEGVSNTVYRCIDDLMRMRSALPVVSAPQTESTSEEASLQRSGSMLPPEAKSGSASGESPVPTPTTTVI
ncbi:E3 ubiquitin-protein ligase hrd1 [Pleurotus ostreatus]|uniref:RING-type E3 ubiquitin transferase n=1 Tax=Pleurotus ostreatus TaxID=5322 RepID=A0A8H6ZRN6_PLEOS|nr:E3 ubiquitin-protein ligase hrd1 [Pleurotus ostreatus]KAF7428415.1 E3 ubiquitin-protein ligase hrd1 [Pleurotus ostreatus]KAJ8696554.1 E3 ubiquitin-protein ligase hrd1 [Pleurotus ostreatus]